MGEHSLAIAITRYHGGYAAVKEIMGEPLNSSSLEERVKSYLDSLLRGYVFVDNGRKKLEEYDIVLRSPFSGACLELDRYYPELRLAIEVQGRQHYESVFGEDRFLRTQMLDEYKRSSLCEQGITLIEVPYNQSSFDDVRRMLKDCGVISCPRIVA